MEGGGRGERKAELMSLQGAGGNVSNVRALHANTYSHMAVGVWTGGSGLRSHIITYVYVLYLLDLVLGSSYVLDRGPWARLEPVNLGSGTRLGYSKLAL